MKTLFIYGLGLLALTALATDIDLKQRVVTFTNLQGRVYDSVQLTRANNTGVIYSTENGGGMVFYTNLAPAQLAGWGLDTNLAQIYLDEQAAKLEAKLEAEQARQRQAEANHQLILKQQRINAEYHRTNIPAEPTYDRGRARPTGRNRIGDSS